MSKVKEKHLSEILPETINVTREYDPEIKGISIDSRKVSDGYLFVAKKGEQCDGRDFIDDAIKNGASAILKEGGNAFSLYKTCPVYECEDITTIAGDIAARFYETASCQSRIVGVTGTNGKTSVSHFVCQALAKEGHHVAVMGTIGNGFLDSLVPSELTTMDVFSLHEAINSYCDQGAEFICMEVSSHSLDQERVSGIPFFCAVFTNLSQDHLDYHQSMDAYAKCKEKLFHMPGLKKVVINLDDAGKTIAKTISPDIGVFTLGVEPESDLKIIDVSDSSEGVRFGFSFRGNLYNINNKNLHGDFNIENILLSFLVLVHLGIDERKAASLLENVKSVSGRLQKIECSSDVGFDVYVDFAHTPDGLEKVLLTLRSQLRKAGNVKKLILVFGCGGGRDVNKRELMAKVAERYVDFVFVTSDNPRNEEVIKIIGDILKGFSRDFMENVFVEEDRAVAIERAIMAADEGDVVVIAGKGHEKVQVFSNYQVEFSDELVANHCIRQRLGMEVSL